MTSLAPFHAEVASAPEGARAAWLTTTDGLRLRAVAWPGGQRGTVMIYPGRTEYAEKYGRVAGALVARGYSVAVIDWRGQGLSDRIRDRPMVGHVGDFREFQRDVAAFLGFVEHLGLPGPRWLLSHSMGGAIAQRTLIEQHGGPREFRGAIYSAPMWRLHVKTMTREITTRIFGLADALGLGARLTPGARPAPTATLGFEGNALTTDRATFDWALAQITAHPDLALGGPSMGWTLAAFREMARLQRRPLPDLPSLVLLGSDETIVAPAMIRARVARAPAAHLLDLEGARHEILMEAPAIQEKLWSAIDAFLECSRTRQAD